MRHYNNKLNNIIAESIRKVLSEAKLEVLRKYHPDIDDETFNTIAQADPKWKETKKDVAGGYTKWLLDLYEKDPSMLNRLRQISDDLKEFNPNLQPDRATIDKVADDSDLHNRVKSLYGKKEVSKQESFNNDIVYNKDGWLVVVPSSYSSSRYWGQGSNWCTASENEHFYHSYTEDGPLYIIINKETDDKWQFHRGSDSYMDINDDPVEPYEVGLPDDVMLFLEEHDAVELTTERNIARNGVEIKEVRADAENNCFDFLVATKDDSWDSWYYMTINGYYGDLEIDQCSVYGNGIEDRSEAFDAIYEAIRDYAENFGLLTYDDDEDKYILNIAKNESFNRKRKKTLTENQLRKVIKETIIMILKKH